MEMERRNILGMVCGYYLSRFDHQAYAHLGCGNKAATHRALAEALGVPPKSIVNWRDEFDPIHDNERAGWHNRKMIPSRRRTAEALADLSENELFAIVLNIIRTPNGHTLDEVVQAIGTAELNDDEPAAVYGSRGATGFKAENAFAEHHAKTALPVAGRLRDRRHDQCGYDFEIEAETQQLAVEVKGLAGESGGIMFTDKEWDVAQQMGDRYFLAVVRNVATDNPQVSLVRNPAANLPTEMRVYTTVQVGWTVSQVSLRSIGGDL